MLRWAFDGGDLKLKPAPRQEVTSRVPSLLLLPLKHRQLASTIYNTIYITLSPALRHQIQPWHLPLAHHGTIIPA